MGRGQKRPPLSHHDVRKVLKSWGFEYVRTTGSHERWVRKSKHGSYYVSLVVNTPNIPRGTLRSIAQQAGVSVDDIYHAHAAR